ncbi:Exopolygalacturonase [Apostasia shenzhenica]|uniref:Exopolygalacturonase n=1 Tax=Apostasia shenzhenica TaxID=1088818 RepID=A0A2I0B5N8_9ASPA|nr:Exopolygalacturonase [Apostasia shenzhenica]
MSAGSASSDTGDLSKNECVQASAAAPGSWRCIEQATHVNQKLGSFVYPLGALSFFLFITILIITSLSEKLLDALNPPIPGFNYSMRDAGVMTEMAESCARRLREQSAVDGRLSADARRGGQRSRMLVTHPLPSPVTPALAPAIHCSPPLAYFLTLQQMDLIILLVASLMLSFLSSESLSLDNSTKIFDIKDYGAVDDGQTNSTQAFLQAWSDACAWEGGSPTLLVPEGMFLVGPLLLGGPCVGPLVVQVNGTVLASSDLSLYGRATEWIKFRKVDGMLVTGAGKFDGQGSAVWSLNDCDDENKTKKCKKLPWSINFSKVTNSTIEGISSINSKGFHIMVHGSSNLNLQSITILAPAGSPNTDGIHLSQSANINISHCTIATGDDCISIGPGTSNLTVSGVLCGPGHGISVGSLGALANESVVADITVRNCTLNGTDNGVRVKTWQESPTESVARNFLFEDIVMVDVANPIIINQRYCPTSACSNKVTRNQQ